MLIQNCFKRLRVTKIFKSTKFEGDWDMLEAKKPFPRDNHEQNI